LQTQEKKRRNREKAAAKKAADLAPFGSVTASSADQVGNTLILHFVQDMALLIIATVIIWMLTCHMAMPVLDVCSPAAAFTVVT
jgi:hypothetical protein